MFLFSFAPFLLHSIMVNASIAKQNFTTEAEDAINRQIQIDQIAQQQYLSTAAYFGRDDIALPVAF